MVLCFLGIGSEKDGILSATFEDFPHIVFIEITERPRKCNVCLLEYAGKL